MHVKMQQGDCTMVKVLSPPAHSADSQQSVGTHPTLFHSSWASPEWEGSPRCQGCCHSHSG